jgi:hypothetical protein
MKKYISSNFPNLWVSYFMNNDSKFLYSKLCNIPLSLYKCVSGDALDINIFHKASLYFLRGEFSCLERKKKYIFILKERIFVATIVQIY